MRHLKYLTLICGLSLLLASPGLGLINPLSRTTGARPLALGNAYIALADDGAGIFTNPAGLASISEQKFISMYASPDSSLSFTLLGAALPLLDGALLLGYRNRVVANVAVSSEVADFSNQEIILAYSKKVRENLALGLDLRFLSQGLSKSVASFDGLNGSGNAFGLFLKYNFRPGVDLALAWQELGGRINYQDNTSEELNAKLTLGTCFTTFKNWTINFDLSQLGPQPVLLHGGVEWQARPFMAWRLGADQTASGPSTVYTNITTGLGLVFSGITLDYTFYRQGDPTGSLTNYIALGYIGAPAKAAAATLSQEATAEAASRIRKVRLLTFKDVPLDYPDRQAIDQLASAGLINYYPDKTFRPQGPVSRAELIMLLVRLYDLPLPQEKKQIFTDVAPDSWAAAYVQAAYENKLTKGYEDMTFRPRKAVTRAVLYSLLKLPDKPPSPNKNITRAELAEALYKQPLVKEKLKNYEFESSPALQNNY